MKKLSDTHPHLRIACCAALVVFAISQFWSIPAHAKTLSLPARISMFQESTDEAILFSKLGFNASRLSGPFGNLYRTFGLPATWQILNGARLDLNLDVLIPGTTADEIFANPSLSQAAPADVSTATNVTSEGEQSSAPIVAPKTRYGGELRITINDVPLRAIPLGTTGEFSVSVPIPASAFSKPRPGGLNFIYFELESPSSTCGDGIGVTSLVVGETSQLVLPHRDVPLAIDLAQLPRPIFQQSVFTDTALLIVPDQPSANDLRAAVNIAAGFGRMTDGNLAISLTRASDATKDMLSQHHLIFVGKPQALPLLKELTLPLPITEKGFGKLADNDDGVVQMSTSPWDKSRATLVVSGNTDAGLLKAAQTIRYWHSSGYFWSNSGVGGKCCPSLQDSHGGGPRFCACRPGVCRKSSNWRWCALLQL